MSNYKFISHDAFPDDPYIHEAAYLEVSGTRVLYVRKTNKTGGKFWTVPNVSVIKNGNKEFLEASMIDSNFITTDIKKFLDNRQWTTPSSKELPQAYVDPYSQDLPF